MKIRLIIFFFCLLALNVFARKVITGTVYEKENNKAVETAIVDLLLLPDSFKIETFYTNTEGIYTLLKADTSKLYCLRIAKSFLKTQIVDLDLKTAGRIVNVGKTLLEPTVFNIREIVVNGSKIQVKEMADRTVYGISTDMKKTSTDGLDILRKVPTVQVDYFNEDIKVEGKSNIVIEVDGVTRDKSYLKKLHPSQVDKMEIITDPTGKYDADVDAVINIITNREMRYGLKGMVNAIVLPNSFDNYMGRLNTSLDYGLKKVSFYIAASGGTGQFDFLNSMDRLSGTNKLTRTGEMDVNFNNYNFNGGLIYDPSEYDNFNLNVSYNANGSKVDNSQISTILDNNLFSDKNLSTINTNNQQGGLNSFMFYKHKFNKSNDHAVEVEAKFYSSLKNENTSDYQYIYYGIDDVELYQSPFSSEENYTQSNSLNTRANYTLKFDSVYTFNSGLSANYNYNYVNNISSVSSNPTLEYINITSSIYAELSRNFQKGNFKVGSRLEVSNVTINTANTNTYYSPLPYANGQYKINDKNTIKLNYSRRVFRPSNGQLNPFVSFVDSLTESRGNINLVPAYRDNFKLSNSVKFGKNKFSGNITPQLFFEYRKGLIQTITKLKEGTSIFEKFPVNISNGYETGINLSVYAQISVVIFNSNVRYTKIHTDKYLDQIPALNRDSWNWNSQFMCPLPKDFRVFAMLNINGPTINGQELTEFAPFYLLGLSKQFKNNSSLTLIALNPLTKKNFYSNTTINNSYLYQKSEQYMNIQNAIMLNYSINFKVGKDLNIQKRDQDSSIENNSFKLPF